MEEAGNQRINNRGDWKAVDERKLKQTEERKEGSREPRLHLSVYVKYQRPTAGDVMRPVVYGSGGRRLTDLELKARTLHVHGRKEDVPRASLLGFGS